MTKQKNSQKTTPLAIKFKNEHPDAYKAAYKMTLLDAFDTEHDTHESFRSLRARPCQECHQQSAFFYSNKCWRCFYAQEFYDHIEDVIATNQIDSLIFEGRMEYQSINHNADEFTNALNELSIS